MSEAVALTPEAAGCIVHLGKSRAEPGIYQAPLVSAAHHPQHGALSVCQLGWDDDWALFAPQETILVVIDLSSLQVPLEELFKRARARFKNAAVLVCDPDGQQSSAAFALGASDVVVSPTAEALHRRMESAMDHQRRAVTHRRERDALRSELVALSDRVARDTLTGLYTRSAFLFELDRALARARRQNSMLAVIYFDLDGFKAVNDDHGHQTGDHLLRWLAESLDEQFRYEDCLGRMGGDEFALLIEGVTNPMQAYASAQKIRELFADEVVIGKRPLVLDVSVGISMCPKTADAMALLSHADVAMYAAKKRPQEGKIRFFDAHLEAQLIAREGCRLRLESKLNRGDCSFALQPVFDYHRCELNAVEALFRWPYSETTQEVVEFAERHGLSQKLDLLMLEQAIAAFLDLRSRAPNYKRLHVNASVLSLDRRYIEHVTALLKTYSLAAGQLCVEVTETALTQDYEQLAKDLRSLRLVGVELALDDFGTGYASLRYLRDLAFGSMKLDRELVSMISQDHKSRALCQASIDMARSLDIKVTGEGVENSDQFALLREMGCDYAQGYYLAKPSSVEAIVAAGPLEFVY